MHRNNSSRRYLAAVDLINLSDQNRIRVYADVESTDADREALINAARAYDVLTRVARDG